MTPAWLEISIFWITQLLMLLGLLGLIVPLFPGLVVMWLAALGYGVVAGFNTLGVILFAVITLLMLSGSLVDNILMGAGARKGGASWGTIAVALLAGVAGTLLFPPIGGILAAPLAVLLLEYARQGDFKRAWRALGGLATGWGLSFILRLGLGFLIMIVWWLWVWQG